MECDPTRWDYSIYLGSGIINSVCLFWSVSLQIYNIAPLISFVKWFCDMEGALILSISGSLDSINMSIFDTPIVLCNCLPSSSHCEILKLWHEFFSKCVWMDEKARISLSNLKIPWDRRVFRLTGSSKYSKWLCQLRIISCWEQYRRICCTREGVN